MKQKFICACAALATSLILPVLASATNHPDLSQELTIANYLEQLEDSPLTRIKKNNYRKNGGTVSIPVEAFHIVENTGSYILPDLPGQIPLPTVVFPETSAPAALFSLNIPDDFDCKSKSTFQFNFLTFPDSKVKKGIVRFKITAQIVRQGEVIGGLKDFNILVGHLLFKAKSASPDSIARLIKAKMKVKPGLFSGGDLVLLKITRVNSQDDLLQHTLRQRGPWDFGLGDFGAGIGLYAGMWTQD